MGGFDPRPPKIIMTNHAQLKETLAKMTATHQPRIDSTGNGLAVPSLQLTPSVTISITVPLAIAASYLALLHSTGQQHLETPTLTCASTSAAIAPPSPTKENVPREIAMEQITEKQKLMINNLIKRKNLPTERIESLLRQRFSVDDSSRLSKRLASQLIDLLMAM